MEVSKYHNHIFKIVSAGLLIAIGMIIPLFSPLQFVVEPASYTLGVHIPIFIAMFISPKVAFAVAVGTTLGFLFRGLPITIVIRAASHILYATAGSMYLARIDKIAFKGFKLRVFSFIIAIVHAVAETVAILVFYIATGFPANQGALWVFGFIGLGTVIHSMVDFELANVIRRALQMQPHFRQMIKS
ncbi:MAG: hypothetical protein FWE33_02005 [Defluviitaleaceae bacterium]|nr:hypothetical protein [Defluviitaleaceae bacterium]